MDIQNIRFLWTKGLSRVLPMMVGSARMAGLSYHSAVFTTTHAHARVKNAEMLM